MTDPIEQSADSSADTVYSKFRRRFFLAVRVLLLIVAIIAANKAAGWLVDQLDPEAIVGHQKMLFGFVAAALVVYAVLIAVPFVPGVEIGIGLFVILGAQMAVFVYLATLAGLSLAFFAGRLVPMPRLQRFFSTLSFERAAQLSGELAPLTREERLEVLISNAPSRWVPFLLRHRYIALAISVNVPGNSLVGGGGGICLLAGMSGLYKYSTFLMILAIAVAPVPILVLSFGSNYFS